MSVIKNTGIKRGDKLTSTALNAEFTAANAAFTMDADNFRNEALDQAAFDTSSSNGKSGIILKQANQFTSFAGTVTIQANTNAEDATPVAATQIAGNYISTITAEQNDILRVYWQYEFNTTGNNSANPIGVDRQHLCWAVWLEWQLSSGGAFTPVTGQSDLDNAITIAAGTRYGDTTANMKATSLDYHAIQFRENSGNQSVYPGNRMGYGQYFYKFTSNTTVYGFRVMARGIYEPVYSTGSSSNAIKITQAAGVVHTFVVYDAQLSYLLMRNE